MGAVYEATQLSLSRRVALKLLAPHLGEDPVFRERFRREGVIQAALDHPHIVPIYEAGESEHGLFLAMRLVRGANLKDLIVSSSLDGRRAVAVLRQAAGALDAAHAAGLVHRDVKPQNVLVAEGDYTYLADFGLTKAPGEGGLTASGQQVGSLDYISPEQIRGEQVTPRSDLYAFGVVFYEALAGAVPYQRDSDAALMYAHLEQEPPALSSRRPDVPAAVDAAVARALAKDPAERPSSATALVDEIEDALAGAAVGAPVAAAEAPVASATVVDIPMRRPVTPPPVSAPVRRSRRLALAAVGATALALAGGALGGRTAGEVTSIPAERAAGAGFDVLVPHGWSVRPGAVAGFPLKSPTTLGRGGKALITVGASSSQHPSLLPAAVRRGLKPALAPQLVRLGELDAYHYERLSLATSELAAYLVPTTKGTLAVVCAATEADACAGVAASLRIEGKTLRPGPAPATARALDGAIASLAKSRSAAARELAAAKKSAGQGAAAARAGTAYRRAATTVSRVAVKPFERAAFARVVQDLRAASAAWQRLAAAARAEEVDAYAAAGAAVKTAEKRSANAVRALAAYGYQAKT
jgi:hypothetical protein